jgi:hypothetical protein
MLRQPLSGDDTDALAIRAATTLAVGAGLAAAGVMSPQRRRTKRGGDAGKGPLRLTTARVAPLLVVSSSGKDGLSAHHLLRRAILHVSMHRSWYGIRIGVAQPKSQIFSTLPGAMRIFFSLMSR